MFICVNCLVENPAFDSQTKETLTTRKDNFGSKCELSEAIKKKLEKSSLIDHMVDIFKAREAIDMKRKLGQQGKKKQRLLGIPKLEDANLAGTAQSRRCTLILTEGDSAKTLAMSGIQIVGRDVYGCFPLRGKLLNVRDANNKVIVQNAEIQHLMKIIGLQVGKNYTDNSEFAQLRYGSVMIMADQDHDGSHIKGLLINFFEHFWPSLLGRKGFLREFVTPIIKATTRTERHNFFTINDYKTWESKTSARELAATKVKYYKGLGTSTSTEAKEYFSDLGKHIIEFRRGGDACNSAIKLAFAKSAADDRKQWLARYDPAAIVDHGVKQLSYESFVNKELIHFSIADNLRSIPSVMDGLKPGQRKILFACFKRKLRSEIKVAQLSGYVAEHSAYHHGENSLQQTIINMAQDFVGSNNINLLLPIGQFGTRAMGGKEAASARYIFTNLNPLTRILFNESDDPLLPQIEEEGMQIEPNFYQPILPMALVNGAEGIGTGWSTFIPCYDPLEIVRQLKARLTVPTFKFKRMMPYYRNFTGQIEHNASGGLQFIFHGKLTKISPHKVEISELPFRKWTRDYKNFLEEQLMMKDEIVRDVREMHTDDCVRFILEMTDPVDDLDELKKQLKLTSNVSGNNMVLFDSKQRIRRYTSETEIMEEFFGMRLDLYSARKAHMLKHLKKEVSTLSMKQRFILALLENKLVIKDLDKKALVQLLLSEKYLT